ncbi:putative extracellular dihydrogeodin oxidase/laccase [Chaetomium fimeti]|uniref:Extracellular dihydrogeodin oxidase/laccase n=1 Tax=Chaetomium fimeti TaxID=1854472 RepID=A0AAE0HNB0_9PEZI|nr:putative extracellular dihydrogeodin oxidase/laccase [Chaetomium fimeti]
MRYTLTSLLAATASSASVIDLHQTPQEPRSSSHHHPGKWCDNSPTSRNCWGNYSIDTDYYATIPHTGKTVEVWLSAQEGICNQDGYNRPCMTFNGTIPGPLITANWGDDLVIHVTNNLESNGTAIHWHGLRQLNTVQYDGVPGVTQCAIAPGETLTYRYKVSQYGSTWYHSHFSLQYSEGLFGPMVFNGPATANYDEDLGVLFLQDWSHTTVFRAWGHKQRYGITHSLSNLLLNGTNTFDCSAHDSDPNCVGGGKKFETVFKPGKKHLIRLANVALDSQFRFSIDGHKLKVIANDLVPIEPYETDSVVISAAQRYDIVVEANAKSDNYWMRAVWVNTCSAVANDNPNSGTGIVRYDASSVAEPTTTSNVMLPAGCADEPGESLVPYVKVDVGNIAGTTLENLNMRLTHEGVFQWTINSSTLIIDWANPTLKQIFDGVDLFPTPYNVVPVDKTSPDHAGDEWAILVIENVAAGALGEVAHPIHLHGHDFWILAQGYGTHWDGTQDSFQFTNPPRRDTAILPAHGYLAIAFRLDNPGVWLVHCHIAWHASQGLSLEFVERRGSISVQGQDRKVFDETCQAWDRWESQSGGPPFPQLDSGI